MGYVNAEPSVTSKLLALLALRQHSIDLSVGIRRVRPVTELLLTNYRIYNDREQTRRIGRIFTTGAIKAVNERIAEIVKQIEAGVSDEELAELTQEAELWQGEIETLKERYG